MPGTVGQLDAGASHVLDAPRSTRCNCLGWQLQLRFLADNERNSENKKREGATKGEEEIDGGRGGEGGSEGRQGLLDVGQISQEPDLSTRLRGPPVSVKRSSTDRNSPAVGDIA